jgi:hypothetical protein
MPVDISTDYPFSRLSDLLSLAIYSNILSTVLYSIWRYYVQPTIRSALSVDIATDYSLCSVWRYTTPDYPMYSTLPGNTTLGYLLYYACRYYNLLSILLSLAIYSNRLSAVLYSFWRYYVQPTIRSALPGDITTDYTLYFVGGYTTPDYPMCSTLPGDTTLDYPLYYACPLQLTVRSPDYPLCSVFAKCYNRLSAVLGYLLCSTISRDTTTEYPLCSTFRYYNRLSALLCLAILQPTIPCALLYLLILQPSNQSTDYPLLYVWRYYKRLSSCCAVLCLAIYVWRSRLKIICTSPGQIF